MEIRNLFKNDHGQVGIGTLIIFIAMVLVAAVAAAVLIQTSGVLQQKAQQTGTEAIGEVSGNLDVTSITGTRDESTSERLTQYDITVKVAAGAGRIDLGQLVLLVENASKSVYLSHNTTADGTHFSTDEIRDDDNSYTGTTYVINSGDLIEITISASDVGISAAPRDDLSFTLTPENGNPVRIDLTTPNSYGIDEIVNLYPVEA